MAFRLDEFIKNNHDKNTHLVYSNFSFVDSVEVTFPDPKTTNNQYSFLIQGNINKNKNQKETFTIFDSQLDDVPNKIIDFLKNVDTLQKTGFHIDIEKQGKNINLLESYINSQLRLYNKGNVEWGEQIIGNNDRTKQFIFGLGHLGKYSSNTAIIEHIKQINSSDQMYSIEVHDKNQKYLYMLDSKKNPAKIKTLAKLLQNFDNRDNPEYDIKSRAAIHDFLLDTAQKITHHIKTDASPTDNKIAKNQKYYILINDENKTSNVNNEDTGINKSNALSNLFTAVKANNLLKSLFKKTTIVDSSNNKVPPQIIESVNNHNILIHDIKQTICDSLLKGDSVLLQARQGVDYAINTEKLKPFEDIKQLYMQQIRHNNGFKSPYFMPTGAARDNGFGIIPKEKSTILSSVSKRNNQIEFTCFYNSDQLKAQKHTLTTIMDLFKKTPEIPYLKQDTIPDIKLYEPKSFQLSEQFNKTVSDYFRSCYTGEPYTPPRYTQDELKKLVSYISRDDSDFFKNVQKAHRTIKEGLIMDEKKRQKDHSRKR